MSPINDLTNLFADIFNIQWTFLALMHIPIFFIEIRNCGKVLQNVKNIRYMDRLRYMDLVFDAMPRCFLILVYFNMTV